MNTYFHLWEEVGESVHRICAKTVTLFKCPRAVRALAWEKGKADFQSLQVVI